MSRQIKILIAAFFIATFMFSYSAYAWKSIYWPISPNGKLQNEREVLEGQIKSFDLEKMEITFGKSELMGKEPLRLTKDTVLYKGNEKTDIISVRGGAKFTKDDELPLENLKAGDVIKCNYSIKDGKFMARRIILITPYQRMD